MSERTPAQIAGDLREAAFHLRIADAHYQRALAYSDALSYDDFDRIDDFVATYAWDAARMDSIATDLTPINQEA